MDTNLKKTLTENILKILPHLQEQENTLETVLELLHFKGVKKEKDLRRLKAEAFYDILDYVDSSDLEEEWQKAYGMYVCTFS